MYELMSVMAGIRRESGEPSNVVIKPHLNAVPDLRGKFATEYGSILFYYEKQENGIRGSITLPAGMTGTFVYPDGTSFSLVAGKNRIG